MIVDKALANCEFLWSLQGGDTGKGGAEHRSFLEVRFTQQLKQVIRRLVPYQPLMRYIV